MRLSIFIAALSVISFALCKHHKPNDTVNISENDLVPVTGLHNEAFENWRKEHKKFYKNSIKTEVQAMKTFTDTEANNEAFNLRKNETYKRSVSFHSDLTFEEKRAYRLGLKTNFLSTRMQLSDQVPLNFSMQSSLPAQVNYTNFLPPVKNQLYCGSCYAFAAIAVVEYHSRRLGNNEVFSEQDLVDCDTSNFGCNGGWPFVSLNFIRKNGISSGVRYEYTGVNETCRRDSIPPIYKVEKVCEVQLDHKEEELKKLISFVGPVASAIHSTEGFFNYGRGVFYDLTCNPETIDHAITIVGYGTHHRHGDYWIIRNSWGETWGVNGYALIARNRNNSACGLAKFAMYVC